MNKSLINEDKYKKLLDSLKKEIEKESFENDLKKVQDIDLNHYAKILNKSEFLSIIEYYKKENIIENEFDNILVLLPGNPEIVFRLCIEAVRYNVNLMIGIEDFCLAQNNFIIELFEKIINDANLKNRIELKNLLKDSEIVELSDRVDKTIIIGNSNLYNRLESKIENLKLNPYGIFEIYSDSEEFQELEEKVFEYFIQNEFESESYNDLNINQATKLINKNGYHFCCVLFSNDKENQKVFKENIDSEYVIINKNPFKKIKFKFEII